MAILRGSYSILRDQKTKLQALQLHGQGLKKAAWIWQNTNYFTPERDET